MNRQLRQSVVRKNDKFERFKKIVRGRTETEILAERSTWSCAGKCYEDHCNYFVVLDISLFFEA